MSKKIILYGLGLLMLGLFLSPPAKAVTVKLGKASQDNVGLNTKDITTRADNDKPTRLDCVRNSNCNSGSICADNKCVTCSYTPCRSYSLPPNSCGITSTTGMAEKSHSSCPDQPQTCYIPNPACESNKVCSSGSCACPASAPNWNGAKCVGCLSDANCSVGNTCSAGSCVACLYSTCPTPLTTPADSCGSTASTMESSLNPACPSKILTCSQPGPACSSVQKCSNGACVSKCDGVFCAGVGSCNPTTGACGCDSKLCCSSGMYFSNSSCGCVALQKPTPCGGTYTLVPVPAVTPANIRFEGMIFDLSFNLKQKSDSVISILTRLFGVSSAQATRYCEDCMIGDMSCMERRTACLNSGGMIEDTFIDCVKTPYKCADLDPDPICTPPANGGCSGLTKYCNSGYTLSGGICVLNCTPPANGVCEGSVPKCNFGYIMTTTGQCIAQAKDDAGCPLNKYVCNCVAPVNGYCSGNTPVCEIGYTMTGSGTCKKDLVIVDPLCGDITCSAGLTCYIRGGCGRCCQGVNTPETSGGSHCMMSAYCMPDYASTCLGGSGGSFCACGGIHESHFYYAAHVCAIR